MKPLELLAKAKFTLGEEVEFAIKSGKDTGLVTGILVCPTDLFYEVIWSNKSTQRHYEFELKKVAK